MANVRVSELVAADALAGTEVVPVVQGGVSKKTTVADIITALAPTSHVHAAEDLPLDTATTADISAAIDALIDGAPGALNTLNELAAALADDVGFATTVTTLINQKISAAQHADIDHTGLPGVGAGGGGTGDGFTEDTPGNWAFMPDEPENITVAAFGTGADLVLSASANVDLSGAGGDATLGLYSSGVEITATTDVTINANVGELTLVDGVGAITLADIRADIAGLSIVTANRQTGNYTLVLGDAGLVIEMNVAGANTLTVPPNSSVAFPTGTVIEGGQYGAGQTTLTPGAGVTIRSSGGKLKTAAQYATFSLRKIGTDEWWCTGELSS